MNNMEIYEKYRSVPQNAKRPIGAGRLKGFTDINSMWRIKCLTEQFGACGIGWYIKTTKRWTESVGDEIAAFVEIELYVKVDGEWSAPIFGTGGNMLAKREKSGVHVSDECYKMATTDAISVACKMLGIGADVYWAEDRTKYDAQQAQDTPQLATVAQIKTIESLCNKHEIDLNKWLANNHVSKDNLTAEDAGKILQTLKTKYGDN